MHPGYLVDDPEGFQTELISDLGALEDKLDLWLIDGAERFRRDPEVSQALLRPGAARGFAQVPGAAGCDSGYAGTGGPAVAGVEAAGAMRNGRRVVMTWADFYLVCFLVGFILSLLSFLAGSLHVHLPHLDVHGMCMPHVHTGTRMAAAQSATVVRSISEPSPRSWPGSAAPDIC